MIPNLLFYNNKELLKQKKKLKILSKNINLTNIEIFINKILVAEVEKIKEVLRKVYGEFNSYLEKKYEEILINILVNGTAYDKYKWITYNQILVELKTSKKNELLLNELLYILTENNDNSTEACIKFLDNLDNKNKELERLYVKLINFK